METLLPDASRSEDVAACKARVSDLLASSHPTEIAIGRLLKPVIADNAISEKDRVRLKELLERQTVQWNTTIIVCTLMISVLLTFAFDAPDRAASLDEATAAVLEAAFTAIAAIATALNLFALFLAMICLLYTAVMDQLDDVVYFQTEFSVGTPLVLCVFTLPLSWLLLTLGVLLSQGFTWPSVLTAACCLGLTYASQHMYYQARWKMQKRWRS